MHVVGEPVFVYSVDNVDQYMDEWMEAGVFKNVVVHCFSGYRAGRFTHSNNATSPATGQVGSRTVTTPLLRLQGR